MGEKIDDLIKLNNINATILANETGISKATISDIIANKDDKNFGYKHILKIANYFNVSLDFLIRDGEEIKTLDDELRFVCNYTGLNEDAIENLQSTELNRNIFEHYFDGEYGEELNKKAKRDFNNKLINSFFYIDLYDYFSEIQFYNLKFLGTLALAMEDYDEFYLLFPEYKGNTNFINDFFEKFGFSTDSDKCKLAIFDIQNSSVRFAERHSLKHSIKGLDMAYLENYADNFSLHLFASKNFDSETIQDNFKKRFEDKYFPIDKAKKSYEKLKENYHKMIGDENG